MPAKVCKEDEYLVDCDNEKKLIIAEVQQEPMQVDEQKPVMKTTLTTTLKNESKPKASEVQEEPKVTKEIKIAIASMYLM